MTWLFSGLLDSTLFHVPEAFDLSQHLMVEMCWGVVRKGPFLFPGSAAPEYTRPVSADDLDLAKLLQMCTFLKDANVCKPAEEVCNDGFAGYQ